MCSCCEDPEVLFAIYLINPELLNTSGKNRTVIFGRTNARCPCHAETNRGTFKRSGAPLTGHYTKGGIMSLLTGASFLSAFELQPFRILQALQGKLGGSLSLQFKLLKFVVSSKVSRSFSAAVLLRLTRTVHSKISRTNPA